MVLFSKRKAADVGNIKKILKSNLFFKIATYILTIAVLLVIVYNGALPHKYKITLNSISDYDIVATRDVENKLLTASNREAASRELSLEISRESIDAEDNANDFVDRIKQVRNDIDKSLIDNNINKWGTNYRLKLEKQQELFVDSLIYKINEMGIKISKEQSRLLVSSPDDDIDKLRKVYKEQLSKVMDEETTEANVASKISTIQNNIQALDLNANFKNILIILFKASIKPGDPKILKDINDKSGVVMVLRGHRIISKGETVTTDKLAILSELGLLQSNAGFDIAFASGVLFLLLLLSSILILYMRKFCRNIINNRYDLVLISVVVVLTFLISWAMYSYTPSLAPLAIPVFIAPMLISVLLDLKLAAVINFLMVIALTLFTKGDMKFLFMSMISGSIAAFLVSGASQRSRLSLAGIVVGVINTIIIICINVINKGDGNAILNDVLVVFINGIVSIVLTIGSLPFWEFAFNLITPLKLLELTNPNQPLIKRMLLEAPGTYHHSLMVGNLAEVATEAIGGNAMLARVGAYFHDVGKLKRPNFFMENQMSENPHDRMTPNLSSLVITSHTQDGVELAEKYKIPRVIRDIIIQHHGTTLVAYFYHKAKKGEKGEMVKPENFRYEGPRPKTKESAVVMLADSVEAAVRSMVDKTEGKIEGLVRKIIKDKLDDGQLDNCDLTLRDLDNIAKSFMRVFSGLFHEREEYPEIKAKQTGESLAKQTDANESIEKNNEEKQENANIN
ncbi:MAG TPA: HDIG domain-containing protein [Clostridia bacterium]